MCAMLETFCRDDAQWFNIRADGHCALSTSHTLSSARFVSTERKKNMAVLGAAIALCLIRGMSTTPLDPVVIHFFIHDCDIHSINPAILGEWHPRLKQTISDWLSLGPRGDPAPFQEHFATFHDLQVSCRAVEPF